jgi:hypothetical protein
VVEELNGLELEAAAVIGQASRVKIVVVDHLLNPH